ncbi:MAG: hypothetical protein EHM58_14280 [Ignavibacteriae bacterium]|nr:MAG: hypothetical protein EHM58_14280 [Ignavibacteriota bacterium]
MIKKLHLIVLIIVSCTSSLSQVKTNNELLKWTTWILTQAIPSVTYYEDRNETDSRLKFGLQWQVIPLSYSFNSNKYVSPVSSFFISPSKRFSGSAEIFFQPEFIPGNFKYADLKKFMFKTGIRAIVPVFHKGEYLSFSLGAGYYQQKNSSNNIIDGLTYEAAVYSFYGMLGVKFNYNNKAVSRYNFGLYFKYY